MSNIPTRAAAIATLVVAFVTFVAACGPSVAPSTSPSGAATASPTGAVASPSPSRPPSASVSATTRPTPTAAPTPTPAPTATPIPTLVPTSDPTEPPPVSEFPQTWVGSWADPSTGGTGALELVLTGKDDAFGGTITMDGTACLVTGTLEGSYDGRDIAFIVSQRGTTLDFTGRAADGVLDGTIRSECDDLDATWTAQRTE